MTLNLNPPWSDDEIVELERLYKAGWRWPDIAERVTGIRGVERTTSACQTRAGVIGILDPARKGNHLGRNFDADIAALMDQDCTVSEMVGVIRERYGVKVSATYVSERAQKQERAYPGWKSRKGKRISDRVAKSNKVRVYKPSRTPNPHSRRSRLRALGIPERSFYSVRGELLDMGIEHTEQDIIDICKARRRA